MLEGVYVRQGISCDRAHTSINKNVPIKAANRRRKKVVNAERKGERERKTETEREKERDREREKERERERKRERGTFFLVT